MLYILYATKNQAETADPGRGTKEEPDRNPNQGRRNGSSGKDRRSRESARELFRSRRNQACDRETIETITRMERDRRRRQPQPIPNPAFLQRGTHG